MNTQFFGCIVFCLMLVACGKPIPKSKAAWIPTRAELGPVCPGLSACDDAGKERSSCRIDWQASAKTVHPDRLDAICGLASITEHTVGVEYAGDFPEDEQHWLCAGYIQQPMLSVPQKKTVVLVRRGTAAFFFHGFDTLLGGAISTDLKVELGDPVPTLPRRIERSVNDEFEMMLIRSLGAVTYASDELWMPASTSQSDKLGGLKIVKHCWRIGRGKEPSTHMWPDDNIDKFPGPNCRDWSNVAGRFVERENLVDFTRFQAAMELQAYYLHTNSDGVKERGELFFPYRFEAHLCGPRTHAESGIEAALRHDAGTHYQLIGYGGAVWEMGTPRPPTPGSWSGHNGAWTTKIP
jgi:hypothetical protein